MKRTLGVAAVALLLWTVLGCSMLHRREPEAAAPVTTEFRTLVEDPQARRGEYAVLGGEILENRASGGGTVLLVLHKPLSADWRPSAEASGDGLFAVRFKEHLDPGLFHRGQRVTVEGLVAGAENEPWGGGEFPLLQIDGTEIRIWDPADWPTLTLVRGEKRWFPSWYDPYHGERPWWW